MSLPRPLTRQEQDSQKGKSDLRFSDIASYIRERLLLEELVSHKLSKEGNEDGIECPVSKKERSWLTASTFSSRDKGWGVN